MFYDLDFDKNLIISSFAMQYGIRLCKEDITVCEFLILLEGLLPDTPLGQRVSIRADNSSGQKSEYEQRIKREWTSFLSEKNKDKSLIKSQKYGNVNDLQNVLKSMFG